MKAMTATSEQGFHFERQSEKKESPPNLEVPIIDIVRHGETEYKENTDPHFKFDPAAQDFKLDAKHLDLTEAGIKNIRETAQQLAAEIDKDNEVVLLVSSPNDRAQSSMLIIKEELQNQGITLLNPGEVLTTDQLRQIEFIDRASMPEWSAAHQAYREEDEHHLSEPMHQAHQEVASRLGKKPEDIFNAGPEQLNERFERFVRHMINLKQWFGPKTLNQIQDKRLRVIAITHEELPDQFIQKTLAEMNLGTGQVLEIRAEDQIRKGTSTTATVRLLPKGKRQETETQIKIDY